MPSDPAMDAHLAEIARGAQRRAAFRGRLADRLAAHGILLHSVEFGRVGSVGVWLPCVSTREGELCTLSLPVGELAGEETTADAVLDRVVMMTRAALDDQLGVPADDVRYLTVIPEVETQRAEILAFRTLLAASLAPAQIEVVSAAPQRTSNGVRWFVRVRGRGLPEVVLRLAMVLPWCAAPGLADVTARVGRYAQVYRTTEARVVAGDTPLPREFIPGDFADDGDRETWRDVFRVALAARGALAALLFYEGTGALAGTHRWRVSYRPTGTGAVDARAWVEVDVRAPSVGLLFTTDTIEAVRRKVTDLVAGGHL